MKKGYKRLINWIEENVDLEEARGFDDGFDMIDDELQDPETDKGAYRALDQEQVRDELEGKMFAGSVSEQFEEKQPRRPSLVKDEEEWKEREAKMVQRSRNTGRMVETLNRLTEGATRREALEELSENFNRAESTIAKDLTAMRNIGWLTRTDDGLWKTTEEGREASRGWG